MKLETIILETILKTTLETILEIILETIMEIMIETMLEIMLESIREIILETIIGRLRVRFTSAVTLQLPSARILIWLC